MKFETASIVKEYIINDNISQVIITNKLTGKVVSYKNPNEFAIGFNMKKFFTKVESFSCQDCKIVSTDNNVIKFTYIDCLSREWTIRLFNEISGEVIRTHVEFDCKDNDVIVDSVEYFNIPVDSDKFSWSKPVLKEFVLIPPYWATLGQPVYYDTLFMGVEFPTADNAIHDGKTSLKIYYGRDIAARNKKFVAHSAVIGASINDTMEGMKHSFFNYVATFARPKRFRIQFNSWYDNMLKITPDNIEKSFRNIHKGFKDSGLRDIDCYVVDDGWVDYKSSKFWAFNDKFKDGFNNEAALTKELNSTFGIWVGPRGGYTQALSYAMKLTNLGFHVNKSGIDICVADPHYIDSLTNVMIDFMNKYNASYFKLDGFCTRPCGNKKHGHIVGGYKDMYFYTNLWENWFKAFDRMRAVNKDVFLNITSYANVSPWMLIHADALWMNNASDMWFEGEGSNLDQCLNYRDGRYNDLFTNRQLQFPNAYIYNHEPCYAECNYNPIVTNQKVGPGAKNVKVVYDNDEFEEYLTMCMMRGTGFVELYYSPSMFDKQKYAINAKVLKWAEDNFDILSNSIYFGGVPKEGKVYGYVATKGSEGYLAIRNPHNAQQDYTVDLEVYTHSASKVNYISHFGNLEGIAANGANVTFTLKPFEMKVIKFNQ